MILFFDEVERPCGSGLSSQISFCFFHPCLSVPIRGSVLLALDFRRLRREDSCMALEFTTSCLKDSISLFRYYKRLGDGAIAQASDEALFATLDAESNSIAIIVKHLSGNMRSR